MVAKLIFVEFYYSTKMRKLLHKTFVILSIILSATTKLCVATANTIVTIPEVNEIERMQSKVVNKHDFEFILNPQKQICQEDKSLFLLIYVHTTPVNLKRRISLRETWTKRSMFRDIRIVFMMGSALDQKTNELVKLEHAVYNDIVQENFHDSYRNLTYKGKTKKYSYPNLMHLSSILKHGL